MQFIIFIIIFILIIFIINKYYINYNIFYFKPVSFNQLNLNNTTSLFWTGGYDSTFRLCQLLIDEKKIVQPIYLGCKYIDSDSKDFFSIRKSKNIELQTMHNIRLQLYKDFPFIKHNNLLKPILFVNKIRYDPIAINKSLYIHYILNKYSRPFNQYERLARFSLYYPTPIEIGLEKSKTSLDDATYKYRIGIGENCRIMNNLPLKYKPLDVYKNFRFSIVHLDKKNMFNIAKDNSYLHILKITWSCWFPKNNGIPCGKCEMCRKRII